MIAIEISNQQRKLTQALHNLDAFAGEWVVLRGDCVAAHDRSVDKLIERDVIQDQDAVVFVPDEDTTVSYLY